MRCAQSGVSSTVSLSIVVACAIVVVPGLTIGSAEAQAIDDPLRFEVASVKPHADDGGTQAGIEENESTVRIGNLPLRTVISFAYGVMASRVVGPGWLERRIFDIVAKPPAGYQRRQLGVLLQNLLADRFKLVAHKEQREAQGYVLRVDRGGHKLRESTGPRTFLTGRPGLIAGNGRSITEITSLLSQMVSGSVVDETALKGAYDIRLEWTAQLTGAETGAEPAVSIFTALREQLGLRLDPTRTKADFVIIDSIDETPTPD